MAKGGGGYRRLKSIFRRIQGPLEKYGVADSFIVAISI